MSTDKVHILDEIFTLYKTFSFAQYEYVSNKIGKKLYLESYSLLFDVPDKKKSQKTNVTKTWVNYVTVLIHTPQG